MDVLNSFIQILSATFTNLVFIISTYYLFLSFFGIIRFKSKKKEGRKRGEDISRQVRV